MSKSKRGSGVIKRAVLFVLLILFVFFSAYVAHNNSHSGRFGDKVGHIVGGKFVLSGKIPYSDLQYNHQPLNYLFSAAVTKVVKADNLYIYIARQREAIFLYAFFWMLVFIFTFSIPGVLFILVFEMSKYWLSGYKLLGETLAVYPFLYMVGVLIGVLFYKKKFNIVTYVLVSVSTFISAFSLLPLWPAILYMNIVFTILLRKSKYCLLALILPALILTLLMFSYLNINDYIRETIIYNYRYFLPSSYGQFSIARMLLMPFMVFLPPYEPYKVVIAFGIGIMVFFSYFAAKSGKIISWMGILLIVLLTNQRMDNFDYSSFHLLPWHGTIIYISISLLYYFLKDQEYKKISITLFFLFAAVVIYVYFYSYGAFIKKKDLINEQYISYSESETYGRVAAVLKNEGDRLLVMPNDPLIYWVADMDTPTRTYEHYGWIYNIPEYQQEMNKILTSSPPEYIVDVGLSPQFGMENKVIDLLKNRYIRLSHVGKQSKFYVLRERYSGITSNQWESLHRMLFTELGK